MDNIENVKQKIDKSMESLALMPVVITNKFASEVSRPVKPVVKNIDNTVKKLNKMRDDISRVLFSTDHHSLFEAVVADLVDALPYVGDATESMRLADAKRRGDKDAVVAHGTDLVVGNMFDIIPVAGELIDSALDLLLPSNMLLYLKRRGYIEWNPPLLPVPPIRD